MLGSSLRLEQKLYLNPQMQYALTLLQMGTEELLQHILEQAMQNPLIALEPISFSASQRTISDSICQEIPDVRNTEELFRVDLNHQLPPTLPSDVAYVVQQLINLLDHRGYLPYSRKELTRSLGVTATLLESALVILHSLAPAGVGAKDLRECLLLQLKRLPDAHPLAHKIVKCYLEDAAAGRLRKIARLENTTLHHVEAAYQEICALAPCPANGYKHKTTETYIIPDIIVSVISEKLSFELSKDTQPPLYRSDLYIELLHSSDTSVQEYLRGKLSDFVRIEQAVAMRNKTLLYITQVITDRQSRFFLTGDRNLEPLSLEDISEEIGLHISTVCRAMQNKYLQCSWGVFPLKFFLSRYTKTKESGLRRTSQDQVCCAIQRLIDAENPQEPLSDQQLCESLQKQGISASRRTVVNYREKMGISSSYVRRQQAIRALKKI